MRWTCPHCSADLTIAEGKLNKSWVFSQCHKCRGHVLLRAPEGNSKTASIHKVHSAPEVSPEKVNEINSASTLAQASPAAPTGKPVIRPAQPRRQSPAAAATEINAEPSGAPTAIAAMGPPTENTLSKSSQSDVLEHFKPLAGPEAPSGATLDSSEQPKMAFSDPQPEQEETPPPFPAELLEESQEIELAPIDPPRIGLVPITLGVVCAIGTAAILFLSIEDQSQDPYQPMKPIAASTAQAPEKVSRVIEQQVVTHSDPKPVSPAKISAEAPAPASVATQHENPQPAEKVKNENIKTETSLASTQLVQYGPPEPAAEPAKKTSPERVAELVAEVDTKKATQTALIANSFKITTLSDQLHSQAMAPERPLPESGAITLKSLREPTEQPPLIVKPRGKTLYLRSGPGLEYPVIGFVNEAKNYIVTDWNDRWYRVLPQVDEVPIAGSPRQELDGWIRTDSVRVVQAQSVIVY